MISWTVSLESVYRSGDDGSLALVVSLAYPCGDLVLGTMGFLLATQARKGGRAVIALLLVGVSGMMISDTFFALTQAKAPTAPGNCRTSAGSSAWPPWPSPVGTPRAGPCCCPRTPSRGTGN